MPYCQIVTNAKVGKEKSDAFLAEIEGGKKIIFLDFCGVCTLEKNRNCNSNQKLK